MALVLTDGTGPVSGAPFMAIGQVMRTVHSIALALDIIMEALMVLMMHSIMALGMVQLWCTIVLQ